MATYFAQAQIGLTHPRRAVEIRNPAGALAPSVHVRSVEVMRHEADASSIFRLTRFTSLATHGPSAGKVTPHKLAANSIATRAELWTAPDEADITWPNGIDFALDFVVSPRSPWVPYEKISIAQGTSLAVEFMHKDIGDHLMVGFWLEE